jgi:hypothetical protein
MSKISKALHLFDLQIIMIDSKDLIATILRLKESEQKWVIELLHPEDEGGTILQNVDN